MAEGPGEDLAKYVAENVGGMPLVQGAGKMGGSLLDLLSRLISGMQGGGGRMAPPPPPPANVAGAQQQQGGNPLMQGGAGGGDFMALLMKLLQGAGK